MTKTTATTASPDARAVVEGWERIADTDGAFGHANLEQITGVVTHGALYIAVGSHDNRAAVWTATDPKRWSRR